MDCGSRCAIYAMTFSYGITNRRIDTPGNDAQLSSEDEIGRRHSLSPHTPFGGRKRDGTPSLAAFQPCVCFMKDTLFLCSSSTLISIIYSYWAVKECSRMYSWHLPSWIWPQSAWDLKNSLSLDHSKDGRLEYPKDNNLEYPKDVHLDFLTATVTELRQLLAHCKVSSVDLVKGYLEQIDKHNHKGMRLNAVISIAPEKDILEQARALDLERVEGKIRGPMHGIPVIIKVSHI